MSEPEDLKEPSGVGMHHDSTLPEPCRHCNDDDVQQRIDELKTAVHLLDKTGNENALECQKAFVSLSECLKHTASQLSTMCTVVTNIQERLQKAESKVEVAATEARYNEKIQDEMREEIRELKRTTSKHGRYIWKISLYISSGLVFLLYLSHTAFFKGVYNTLTTLFKKN